ncbi:MAG: sulfotransferase family 2 domain-containing protein [Cyanobium sp. M30B3]|nr:MAG: sulfotransferase family 2 domain-containing protein [Cyanobium sp. M30B3]
MSQSGHFPIPNIYDLSPRPDLFYGNTDCYKDADRYSIPKLELDHLPISMVLSRLQLDDIKSLIFFSTVRHPWDRFMSEYNRKKATNDNRLFCAQDSTFEDFLIKFTTIITNKRGALKSQFNASHFWPQHYYAGFSHHADIDQYCILHLERLELEWYNLEKKLGFIAPLPARKNSSKIFSNESMITEMDFKSKHPKEYSVYRDYYELDYKLFNYQ